MSTDLKDTFLQLVRLGLGCADDNVNLNGGVSWQALENIANEHGLLGVVLDGVEKLPRELRPEKKAIIQSIGQLIQSEQQYAVQEHAATEMALLLHQHGIRTYVLKGGVVAECYPRPEHRRSVDMDCFLVNDNDNVNDNQGSLRSKSFENLTENLSDSTLSADSKLYTLNSQQDIWERGNRVLEEQGFEVRRDFYKNSTVLLPGLTVENHRYLTPFRGNKRLKNLEQFLQSMIVNDNLNENGGGEEVRGSVLALQASFGRANVKVEASNRRFQGTWMYRPPVMVSALFLIEHAYSHFLHEGLTWRMVLDWQMFCRRHRDEMDWQELEARVDEFGFRRFYDVFNAIGVETFHDNANENDNQRSLRADYRRPQTRLGQTNEFDGSHCSFGSKSEDNHSENLSTFDLSTDSKRLTIDDNLKSKMLEDIWAPLDVHETVTGLRGKLALAGNTWRARWKYRLFTDMTWLQALWIQAKGVVIGKFKVESL